MSSRSSESQKLVSQGLPILLLLSYLLFPKAFRRITAHPLGKTLAVFFICFYTYQDRLYGILVCLLVILYYHCQSDAFVSYEPFLSKSTSEYATHLPKSSRKEEGGTQFEGHLEKDFTPTSEAYPSSLPPIKKVSEALFRKERCHQSKVTTKDQTYNNHMVTHVYPELQFRDGVCNPCDSTCHFTIQSKQDMEANLAARNTHTTVLEDVAEMFGFAKSEPTVVHENMVVSEYA
jgi:hypothetical protein